MQQTRLLSMSLLTLVLLGACVVPTSSFAPSLNRAPRALSSPSASARFLSAIPEENDTFSSPSPAPNKSITTTLTLPQNVALLGAPAFVVWATEALSNAAPAPTPFMLSEILTDLSHVALDLVTLWGPSAVVVRLAAVIGRIFVVIADYLPDSFINPEEVMFQSFMLVAALAGLVQGIMPQLLGQFLAPAPTFRDGKAYKAWGQPAGMTWDQYKALTVNVLEWKELSPGQSLHVTLPQNESNVNTTTLYWLYKGEVAIERNGNKKKAHSISRNGNGHLRQVDGAQYVDLASFQSTASETSPTDITAGSQGATLLVCHMDRLAPLLRHDSTLKDVWKVILWQGLQDQLADAYHHQDNVA